MLRVFALADVRNVPVVRKSSVRVLRLGAAVAVEVSIAGTG